MKHEKIKKGNPLTSLTRVNYEPLGMIMTDPLGSYIGRPADPYEMPVQDADDL